MTPLISLAAQRPATESDPDDTNWHSDEDRAGVASRSLLRGVLTFPFYLSSLLPWFLIALFLTLTGELATMLIMIYVIGDSMFMALGSLVLMSFVWLACWTLSYTLACAALVVEETAAGADVVSDWPLFNWREWFWAALPVGFLLALTAGLAYGVELAIGPWMPRGGIALCVAALLMFPVFWLATLEQGAPLSVFSAAVYGSLWRRWRIWLAFHAVATPLLGLPFLTALVAPIDPAYLVAVWCGPLVATVLLIYARLVGRLGWQISQAAPDTQAGPPWTSAAAEPHE